MAGIDRNGNSNFTFENMKIICTILGTMMAASLLAQDNSNSLPAIPPPVTSPAAEAAPAPAPAMTPAAAPAPAPAKHAPKKRKPVVKHAKPMAPEPMISLTPGQAQVNASELTVRGQAGLKGETVAHLHKGDTVTVLEQINLSHHASDEPAQWAKIALPNASGVWVNSKYITADGTVASKKLNLRAGPGENYSVVGVVEHGTSVSKIESKGDWTKISPPTSAYAFVAAKYLTEVAAAAPMSNPTPTEMPEQTQVPQQQPMIMTPQAPAPPPTPTVRIVQHEGIVGSVGSLVAPTDYKLYDLATKQDVDFLYPISKDLDLSKLIDADVIVTGEEGVDQRWPNTPIMAIQSIQVVRTNVIKHLDLTPPRQRH